MEEITKSDNVVNSHIGNDKMELVKRTDCRKIKDEFYKKGDSKVENSGGCYYINNKWYRDNTGYIVFEHSKGEYILKSKNDTVYGIVDINTTEKGDIAIMGYIYKDKIDTRIIIRCSDTEIIAFTTKVYDSELYVEDLSNGNLWERTNLSDSQIKSFNRILDPSNRYKNSLSYTADNAIKGALKEYEKASKNVEIKHNMVEYFKDSGVLDYTFGVEFETISGIIPDRLISNLGLIPVRDGSVQGLEYATVPLKGIKGFNTISTICDELTKRTLTDDNCSLHVHVGGIPRTMEYLTALFKVLCLVEDEVYDMFPSYKKNNRGFKRKNYTKPLPSLEIFQKFDRVINSKNIKNNFDHIFRYLSGGQSFSNNYVDLDQVSGHPSDTRGTRKWAVSARYHWVNMIPIIFGNKQTVEFRVHTSTMNKNKVRPYIMLCMGILDFVKHNQKDILNGDITRIQLDAVISNSTLSDCEKNDTYDYIYKRTRFINRNYSNGIVNPSENNFQINSHNMDKIYKSEKLSFDKSYPEGLVNGEPRVSSIEGGFQRLEGDRPDTIEEVGGSEDIEEDETSE
jgi:hypothetical protein